MQEVNEKYLEKIKRMRFMDDDFMCAAFKDDPIAVREVLVPIMGREDLTVQSITVQDTYTNLRGHSVRLDVVATDATGKIYDIEIQRADHGAAEKRARYNLGMLDSHNLAAGGDYGLLPETWIIFITEHDVLGKGLEIYHIERIIRETGDLFDDAEHIIYVNGENKADTELGRLMSDFRATEVDNINSTVLANKMRALKETEEGRKTMCRIMEEERAEGRAEGRAEERIRAVLNLLSAGFNDELIKSLQYSDEEIGEGKALLSSKK